MRGVDAAATVDHVVPAGRAIGRSRVTRVARRAADAVDVREGQPVLPGIIGAQEIGPLGAVGIDVLEVLIGVPIGIGGVAKTTLGGTANGLADRRDERAEALFVGVGP